MYVIAERLISHAKNSGAYSNNKVYYFSGNSRRDCVVARDNLDVRRTSLTTRAVCLCNLKLERALLFPQPIMVISIPKHQLVEVASLVF